ncbi:MAG TPA: hypothetical protein PLU26_03350 [Candidatus Competibacter sp.]|nr:hypothetical protein [Candidatus Competibacteraceae bacterium]HUM93501.1 hypothetical protein [Candidatus Competibacter sp.]
MGIEITAIDVRIEKFSLPAMAGAAAFLQRTGPLNVPLLGLYGLPAIGGALAAYNMLVEMPGTVTMTDVNTMVQNVIDRLEFFRNFNKNRKMSRLNILDHGNAKQMEIGSDCIDEKNIGSFSKILSLLKGKFDPSGFVHLQNCEIGNNEKLLAAFARIVSVPVYAGTGYQNSVLRVNTGDYVRANPDGTINKNARRP